MITSGGNLMEIMISETQPGDVNASVIRIQRMAMNLTIDVIYLALQTQVVEERPVTFDTG